MFNLKSIPNNVGGKIALLRADFNAPIIRGRISDDFRLLKTLPTIQLLSRKGAKVILMSHFECDGKFPSLHKTAAILKRKIKKFKFVNHVLGPEVEKIIKAMSVGDVLLLENLRLNPGEKNNDASFAKKLANLGDIYVNDAFSASHRKHASIVGITEFLPSYAGPLFQDEVKNLSRVFFPPRPFLLIVGGNKFSTKAELLKKFFKKADRIVVGGLMVAPILKTGGHGIGKTFVEKKSAVLAKELSSSRKILMPKDLIVSTGSGKKRRVFFDEIGADEIIRDFGPESMKDIGREIKKSRFILWNGPLGYIEKGFTHGTASLVRDLANSNAEVVAGGGDTVAFINRQKMMKKFSFVSTAGGAMLDFLISGTLPGIEALKKD
ncbi:MAG: phosphoglycerate kinase [Patescibacteria group bacterium]